VTDRLRYLVDIIILFAAVAAFELLFDQIYRPNSFESGTAIALISKIPLVLVIWLLLRTRGETPATIGLRRPKSWLRAIAIGIAVAIAIYCAVLLSEKAGFRRDLSAFSELRGNLKFTALQVFYVLTGAGFYEEGAYRGFLFHRLAMLLGGSRSGWLIACLIQAGLFGWGHAYQNPFGMLVTGTIGLIMGIVFLKTGRNLWPVIIAHGAYDAARTIQFYFTGAPPSS
jgi:membrane protease YdiL (CAAX protease family)